MSFESIQDIETNKSSEKIKTNNFSENNEKKIFKEYFNLLFNNLIDNEGNIDVIENNKLLDKYRVEHSLSLFNDGVYHEDSKKLRNFKKKLKEKVLDNTLTILERIILIKVLGDAHHLYIEDELPSPYQNFLLELSTKENVPFLLRFYAESKLNVVTLEQQFFPERSFLNSYYDNYQIQSFRYFNIERYFTNEMKEKILLDENPDRNINEVREYVQSEEAQSRDIFYNLNIDFCERNNFGIEGNYFVSYLKANVYGVFSVKGDLVAILTVDGKEARYLNAVQKEAKLNSDLQKMDQSLKEKYIYDFCHGYFSDYNNWTVEEYGIYFFLAENFLLSQDLLGIQEHLQEGDDGYLLDQQKRKAFIEYLKDLEDRKDSLGIDLNINVQTTSDFLEDQINLETKEDLALFKIILSLPVRLKVKKEFGIELSDYSLRVQYEFLQFITSLKNNEDLERIKLFLNKGKSTGAFQARLKSFLSLSKVGKDVSLAADIFFIDENYSLPVANKIFRKYGDLLDGAEKLVAYVHKNMLGEIDRDLLEKIYNKILEKADNLLVLYKDQQYLESEELILQNLDQYKSELVIFSTVFKELINKKDELSFEEFLNIQSKQIAALELSSSLKKEMQNILIKNWQNEGSFQSYVLQALENSFGNKNTEFELLFDEKELLAFLRFDKLDANAYYCGSFNVDHEARGAKIGSVMLSDVLNKRAKENILYADALLDSKVITNYLNEFNFVIDNISLDVENTGRNLAFLVRNDKEFQYKYKKKSNVQILKDLPFLKNKKLEKKGEVAYSVFSENPASDLDFLEQANILFQESYVITFYGLLEEGKFYVIYEKKE